LDTPLHVKAISSGKRIGTTLPALHRCRPTVSKGTRRILAQAKIAPSTTAPATKSLLRSSFYRQPRPSAHLPPNPAARGFLHGRLSDAGRQSAARIATTGRHPKHFTEDDAVKMANDTEFGLASYFYSRDIAASGASPKRSNTASSGINEGIISIKIAPFGGMKESGIGREGSKYGIEEFLEVKYLCMGRHRPVRFECRRQTGSRSSI
jgi:hypothetical protein